MAVRRVQRLNGVIETLHTGTDPEAIRRLQSYLRIIDHDCRPDSVVEDHALPALIVGRGRTERILPGRQGGGHGEMSDLPARWPNLGILVELRACLSGHVSTGKNGSNG